MEPTESPSKRQPVLPGKAVVATLVALLASLTTLGLAAISPVPPEAPSFLDLTNPGPPQSIPGQGATSTERAAFRDLVGREFKLSAAEADIEVLVNERAGYVGAAARRQAGPRFGGAWVVRDLGGAARGLSVAIVGPNPSDHAAVTAAAGPVPVTLVPVRFSESELMQAAQDLGQYVGGAERILIDSQSNSLTIRIEPGSATAVETAVRNRAATIGVSVTVRYEHVAFVPAACTSLEIRCDPPLRGGVRILSGTPNVLCSTAFSAVIDGFSGDFALTAGHCTNAVGSTATWYARRPSGALLAVGSSAVQSLSLPAGSGPDVARVRVTSPATWTPRNWIVTTYSGGGLQSEAYGISNWLAPVNSQSICKTGATAGSRCGTTTARNGSNLWETTGIPVSGGDSGGAVWWAGVAQGILDGSGAGSSMYFTDIIVAYSLLTNVHPRTS
jgi:hypothetical protein